MLILVRDDEASDWRPLVEVPPEDAETTGPLGFTKDGTGMYLQTSVDSNTGRLVKMDIASGAVEVIAEDPDYDITGAIMNPDTREIDGVIVYGDRVEYRIFDDSMRADIEALQQLNDGDLVIADRDHDDSTWLVAFDSDVGPGEVLHLGPRREERDVPVRSPARAQRLPAGADGAVRLHGARRADDPRLPHRSRPASSAPTCPRSWWCTAVRGPATAWGLDPEAQWLANRGYLCVHVNFRGSSGYGKDFLNAGDREWGAKMHDDLLDAIDHLVAQGIVDRERVAIYGGSYGGYAALVGATFTPDVFKCAISMVGPSNLNTLMESFPEYWKPMIATWHKRVGEDPATSCGRGRRCRRSTTSGSPSSSPRARTIRA